MKHLSALALGAATALWGASAFAQFPIPNKPMVFVVPHSAGGGTDVIARNLGDAVSKILNITVLIENRSGAGGSVGAEYVAKRAAPDGHTIMISGTSVLSVGPAMTPLTIGYDVERDFASLGLAYTTPNVIVINPKVPAKNLQEFIAYAKANPGKMNYGSAGVGSFYHLGLESLKHMTGTNIRHIPYKGGNDALKAAISGEVQLTMSSYSNALPQIKEGNLVALGNTGRTRVPTLPDLPNIMELGLPEYEMVAHVAVTLAKATPKPTLDILQDAFKKANASPELTEYYKKIGAVQEAMDPDVFWKFHVADVKRFRDAAKAANIYKGP